MPGHLLRSIIGTALYFSIFVCLSTATLEHSAKLSNIVEPKGVERSTRLDNTIDSKSSQEGFRFFRKEPSIVTSIIVGVYNKGNFDGFLLIDRGRPPLGPALPGGIVRYKEKPEDCVKRTLFDECGISSISNMQQFRVYSDPARDPRMHAVDVAYSVRIDDQKISSGTDAKHTWVCPLDKIPWDKLVFDHKDMLKAYCEYLIASNDPVEQPEKIKLGSTTKNGARNKNDFESVAKQAYRPPHLFVAGIVEVYEDSELKGIAIADFKQEQNVKLLPAGGVAYGETVEQAFQRNMKEKYHAETSILNQFKTYSFLNDAGKKHDITTVFLAKANKKELGDLHIYTLDGIPWEKLGFHHKNMLEDYLKYRRGEKVDLCTECKSAKVVSK